MKFTTLLFSVLLLLFTVPGFADFTRVGAFGGGAFNNVGTDNSGLTTDRNESFAGGASVEAAVAPDFGLETGFLASQDRLQIPLFARFLGDKTFTIAVGPVAESVTGDVNEFNFGLAAAPGLNFPITESKLNIFVETRVMRLFRDGLTNFNDDRTHLDALAGIRIALR